MDFQLGEQLGLRTAERDSMPSILRGRIESVGVLVFRKNDLTNLNARGICLYDEALPAIVYGAEAPSAQAFTLAHEFGHILLAESAISGKWQRERRPSVRRKIENWCNKFAASFLVPAEALGQQEPKPARAKEKFDEDRLDELANLFAVSRHAMLIRLMDLGYVRSQFYWEDMRSKFVEEESEYQSGGFGRTYWAKKYVNDCGGFYTGLVSEALTRGLITSHNAAEYMGIKNLKHLPDILKDLKASI